MRDLHAYPITGFTDTTVTAHMTYQGNILEDQFTSHARKHNFIALLDLYQVTETNSCTALLPERFDKLTATLESLVKKVLQHELVSDFTHNGIFFFTIKGNLARAEPSFPAFANVLQLTRDPKDKSP